ncbi:MAG: ZIP family metal transporter [Actinomycetota bacterium]|nr:ZIP family metal transporter [Actinomycetota bacterium]MED5292619.1 ZIP family metal transporter [Actinomycetota bacterium]MEE3256622.1 ZIP family metal transporter [Actinomycetota bacterium]
MVIFWLSLIVVVVSLTTSFGGLAAAERLTEKRLQTLTSVASGLLLGSALLVVLPEGFHMVMDEDGFAYSPLILGVAVAAGFVFMLVLESMGLSHAVHEEHHGHEEGHGHGHVHHPASGSVMSIGLSMHAIGDGLAIGAATASGETSISLLVAFGVLVHRVPAALSLGVFSSHETASRRSIVGGFALFALATPVGAIVANLLLVGADESLTGLVLLFSAGTFIYVTTVDTLPSVHNPETGPRAARMVVASAALFTAGLLLLNANGLLKHTHGEHDHGQHDHSEHDEEELDHEGHDH